MRVSRSLRDTAYKAINAREVLTKKLNHEPTIDVIAKEIDMKKEDVLFALDAIATPLSLMNLFIRMEVILFTLWIR